MYLEEHAALLTVEGAPVLSHTMNLQAPEPDEAVQEDTSHMPDSAALKVPKYQPEVAGVAAGGKVVPDVDAVALAVGGDLAADVAHVVAVKLGLQNQIAIQ